MVQSFTACRVRFSSMKLAVRHLMIAAGVLLAVFKVVSLRRTHYIILFICTWSWVQP